MKTKLIALILTTSLPLVAQTATHPTIHHTTVHHPVEGGCVKLPEISPKIPALAPGLGCAKALYTLTRTPDVKLDYASPLLSPETRDAIATGPSTYTLAYIDTQKGTGPLAVPGEYYTVHYTGYLTSGTKFDSSLDRGEPISFPYGQHRVIQGWDTGFDGMHIGGKRRLFVPYQLAYGEAGRPPIIPAKSMLVFDVELIGQSATPPAPKAPPARTPPPAAKPEGAETSPHAAASSPASTTSNTPKQ
ncbi:FKBP-type peptidyl-prolyl cis-trans isomerase [Granulicella sp. 5B5]|uniref:FKBP-type peptidyl-prolyl cis-trans isomerase n=1 Tax=Granulicella sp. 5B5 TaxID=1617967 RepID=UPI001C70CCD0|nr:FKBP-type peptidyl-prolyl cis-trans isomerase [Granulicella sp. 5B5]